MDVIGWDKVVTALSSINILLLVYILTSFKSRFAKHDKTIEDLSRSIPDKIEKALEKFDALCIERQAACSKMQNTQVHGVCTKLEKYAGANDKHWEELIRQREVAWQRYEANMARLWDAISKHTHEGSGVILP